MIEILQLIEASVVVTAVTIAAITAPVAIFTGTEVPDISPLMESVEDKTN